MKQIVPTDRIVALYESGMSVNQIEDATGVPASTVWRRVKKAGVSRSSSEAVRLAISQGRGASKLRGRRMSMSPEAEARFRQAAKIARRKKAKGWRITSQGYVEYTMGEHAGRRVHCVIIERRIGRRLLPDEVVHHIDGDKENNDESNLALMTVSAHSRIHRIQENNVAPRTRQNDGRFAVEGTHT
jgi:hypothetical protein